MREPFGSVAWLERTGGRVSFRERVAILFGMAGALREGFTLGRRARRGSKRAAPLFEAPDTPMVRDARVFLADHCATPMVNHSIRTGFWTLAVLHQHLDEIDPTTLETSWVAALLHDVGLENPPPAGGDFSLGGIEVLERFAAHHRWPDAQVDHAREAIATNLSARVDRERSGMVAWAMNVGGIGELGFRWHRAQMHPDRIAELEARYPRTDLVPTSKRLIRAEAKRVRGGRFGFFRWMFPLILRA